MPEAKAEKVMSRQASYAQNRDAKARALIE